MTRVQYLNISKTEPRWLKEVISFDHHLFRVEKKGLRQISPQKPSVCVILSVYVLAPIMEHSRRTETVRERGRGRKKKKE